METTGGNDAARIARTTLITVAELQRRLCISRRLAYTLVARGEIPSVAIGRRRLISLAALEAFIVARTIVGGGAR